MNRIAKAFQKKAFIAFITGGDPDIETTEKLIVAMAEAGADIIEIGIPFSDPVAEGPVIQKSSERALAGGCTVDMLFDMVKRVRDKVDIPLLFMTYANPIYAYGKERFMATCQNVGIDGVIVPDVPFEEKEEMADVCAKYGIMQISMIAPTSDNRAKTIAADAEGFMYCVSSMGVTGMRDSISNNIADMIGQVKSVSDIPCAIGFGISTREQVQDVFAVADGVIVGSAIVNIIAEHGRDCVKAVQEFIQGVK